MNRHKSSVDEIRRRFDADVERFSSLETGHAASIDATLILDLTTAAAAAATPHATALLDVGCGAGNYTLKLLQHLPAARDATLIDISAPMLERARERVVEARPEISAHVIQADIREVELPEQGYDVIVAAAVLHHLRRDAQWERVFAALHRALRPGGGLWISDLILHDSPAIQGLMWERYGEYLTGLRGEAYRDEVFAYIDKEDTPRSLMYQLSLMERVGFGQIEVLHKNSVFAAFGGIKRG